jgi:WD40 repeat protein
VYEAVIAGLPEEVDVVCYFLTRRSFDADGDRFLTAVIPQLAVLCGEECSGSSRDLFNTLWQRAGHNAMADGRHLLLVIDGLDEDLSTHGPPVAALIPALCGEHSHVLVSSRPFDGKVPVRMPEGHPLTVCARMHLDGFEGWEQLRDLGQHEIDSLVADAAADDLSLDVLGLLTAAAGPLSPWDLAVLHTDPELPRAADVTHVETLLSQRAARSLEPVGPRDEPRYRFAHQTLSEHARGCPSLGQPEYRDRIHVWAARWRERGWPVPGGNHAGTPLYLLDTYPATLLGDPEHPSTFPPEPERLADLCADVGWVDTAIRAKGVDHVLGTLRAAAATAPADQRVSGLLAAVGAQAQRIRPPHPVDQPGYTLRQLCLQAMEHGRQDIADAARQRLMSLEDPGPVPWWTMVTSRPPALELGTQEHVGPAAAFPDDRVVTCGDDGRVLQWDLHNPGRPVEIGRQRSWDPGFMAAEALPPRWVVTGGADGRVLLWDRDTPGADPVVLGHHDGQVTAVRALPGGRVITGGFDGYVRIWDPQQPGTDPVELGRWPTRGSMKVWVTADRQVVIAGFRGPMLRWDPEQPGADPVLLGWRGMTSMVGLLPGDKIVSAEDDGRVLTWDSQKPVTDPIQLGNHGARVEILQVFSGRILTGGVDGWVLEWDPGKPGAGPLVVGHHDARVEAVETLPDGRIVTTGQDGRVRVWDLDPAGVAPVKPGGHDTWAQAVGYRNDSGSLMEVGGDYWDPPMGVIPGGQIVTGGPDGRVLLWDPDGVGADPVEVGRHEKVGSPIQGMQGIAVADSAKVTAVGVIPGGIVTAGNDGRLLRWDLTRPGTNPVELASPFPFVTVMRVLPDGRVLTGEMHGRVLMWDPTTPGAEPTQLVAPIASGTAPVPSVIGLLEDGRVVMLCRQLEQQVLVWDPETPTALPLVLSHYASALGVFSNRVIVGDIDGRVTVQNLASPGAQPVELGNHGAKVEAVEVLPDGRVVTAGADGTVRVGDPGKPQALEIKVTCPVRGFAISPPTETQDVWLAVAHGRQGLSVWNPRLPIPGRLT